MFRNFWYFWNSNLHLIAQSGVCHSSKYSDVLSRVYHTLRTLDHSGSPGLAYGMKKKDTGFENHHVARQEKAE